mgnify:CR=1 FL=1
MHFEYLFHLIYKHVIHISSEHDLDLIGKEREFYSFIKKFQAFVEN